MMRKTSDPPALPSVCCVNILLGCPLGYTSITSEWFVPPGCVKRGGGDKDQQEEQVSKNMTVDTICPKLEE